MPVAIAAVRARLVLLLSIACFQAAYAAGDGHCVVPQLQLRLVVLLSIATYQY